ncbi:MAG: hypothetical protein AB1726_11660 [Planctomycetota bacterium]
MPTLAGLALSAVVAALPPAPVAPSGEELAEALAAALAPSSPPPPDARLARLRTLADRHAFAPPASAALWAERAAAVRRRVLVAAGLWPLPARTPLAPVVHGRLEREGYTIERVFLASRPGLYVTGSLYRPAGRGTGPHPAVLSPHGHWTGGRFSARSDAEVAREIAASGESDPGAARYHLQARCVELARMGCVVFHYDMAGFADSRQLPHGAGFGDAESELFLRSAFGVQTWSSIRALDFLAGLPDVDPARIGVTGASGGGTQTFILCAVDDRPAAAFPAVMVSAAMQGGCVCENASHLRVGTDNVEIAALAAPRPLALTGANDWTIDIETDGYPALKEVYRLLGAPANVFAKCFPAFGHNYNRVSRELMYAWFARHLGLGIPAPIRETPFVPVPPAELAVFDAAHPLPADAVDVAGLAAILAAEDADLLARLRGDLAALRRIAGPALEVMVAGGLPGRGQVTETVLRAEAAGPVDRRDLALARRGTDEAVPALLLTPRGWNGRVVVSVGAGGRAGLAAAPRPGAGGAFALHAALLAEGAAVLVVDVLLAGDPAGRLPVDEERHAQYAGTTWGYNRTLGAERVQDVLTAIAFARDLSGATAVSLAGLGDMGPWAILARALAGGTVDRLAAEPAWSFAEVESLADPRLLPGARKYGDLPAFLALGAPAAVRLAGERAAALAADDLVRAAYPPAPAGEAIAVPLDAGLARWLATAR